MSSNKRKKWPRVLLIIAVSLIAVFCVIIIVNKAITKNHLAKIEYAYGEYYETEAGRINYTIVGNGERTIVILPGHGSPSPHYEFLNMATELSAQYKVIIIEPLGYGLSDDTKVPRTSENICNEIHEVLSYLGEDRYFICGHSIAGIYALQYANMYEEELEGFIGLDASVPAQLEDGNPANGALLMPLYRLLLVDTGVIRVVVSSITGAGEEEAKMLDGSYYEPLFALPAEDASVYAELISSRTQNGTVIAELQMFDDNCADEASLSFPESVPVLYILSQESVDSSENWLSEHEDLATNNPMSRVSVIEGNHFVHLSNEGETYNLITEWLENM